MARVIALQALFEADKRTHKPIDVLQRILDESAVLEEATSYLQRMSEPRAIDAVEKVSKNIKMSEAYSREILEGISENLEKIDSLIRRYATEFPIQQLSAVDRNVLRVAIWETLFDNKTPSKVAINEAVEIAKTFGTEASSKFVNGVLGSVLAAEAERK